MPELVLRRREMDEWGTLSMETRFLLNRTVRWNEQRI